MENVLICGMYEYFITSIHIIYCTFILRRILFKIHITLNYFYIFQCYLLSFLNIDPYQNFLIQFLINTFTREIQR